MRVRTIGYEPWNSKGKHDFHLCMYLAPTKSHLKILTGFRLVSK